MVTGARRKSMTTYQEINSAARSTQDEIKVRYTAKTHTSGGRRGGVSNSDDGRLDVKFSAPGVPGSGTNPEQLFAAAKSLKPLWTLRTAIHVHIPTLRAATSTLPSTWCRPDPVLQELRRLARAVIAARV
jgi:hypothetical protein